MKEIKDALPRQALVFLLAFLQPDVTGGSAF